MCSWPGGCLLWHAELAHVFFGVRRLGDSASKASAPLRHPRHQLQQLECTQLRPGVLTFSPDLHELVLFLVLSAGNSKKTPPSGHSGDHAVLLEFIGGGYGANVAAAWVMPQATRGSDPNPNGSKDPTRILGSGVLGFSPIPVFREQERATWRVWDKNG